MRVAEWLLARPEVKRVVYPALPGDPGHALWKRDFLGASGLVRRGAEPGAEGGGRCDAELAPSCSAWARASVASRVSAIPMDPKPFRSVDAVAGGWSAPASARRARGSGRPDRGSRAGSGAVDRDGGSAPSERVSFRAERRSRSARGGEESRSSRACCHSESEAKARRRGIALVPTGRPLYRDDGDSSPPGLRPSARNDTMASLRGCARND